MAEKNLEQTALFAAMVAKKQDWVLNPDQEFTDSLVDGLTVNFNRYQYYLCPCRDSEGSREADQDVICPCRYSWEDVREHGHCFCALFLSQDFAASGRQPAGIPDKRLDA